MKRARTLLAAGAVLLALGACGGPPKAREYESAQEMVDALAARGITCFEVTAVADEDPFANDVVRCTLEADQVVRLEIVNPDVDVAEAVRDLREADPKGRKGFILFGPNWAVFTTELEPARRIQGAIGGALA